MLYESMMEPLAYTCSAEIINMFIVTEHENCNIHIACVSWILLWRY